MNTFTLTRSLVFAIAIALAVSCAATASAEMILLSAQRSIQGIGYPSLEPMIQTFDGFEDVHTDLLSSGYVRDENLKIVGNVTPSATQTSTIAPDRIRGLGRGSGFASGPDAEAIGISTMEVMFEITPTEPDQETRYSMAGELRITHGIGLNGSSAFIRLDGPTGTLFEIRMDEDHPPQGTGVIFSGADVMLGVLEPGIYTLSAMSEGHGSAGMTRCADFDFTFGTSLAIIPEPASAALVAMLTLVGVPWLRRRA